VFGQERIRLDIEKRGFGWKMRRWLGWAKEMRFWSFFLTLFRHQLGFLEFFVGAASIWNWSPS